MQLDFGKHKDGHLDDCPISYVLFLANRALVGNDGVEDYFEHRIKEEVWDKRDEACTCRGAHRASCFKSVLGDTLEATIDKAKLVIAVANPDRFEVARQLAPLNWVLTKRPHIVQLARDYVDGGRLCWKCGRQLAPVSRQAADGNPSILHKKCWKKCK